MPTNATGAADRYKVDIVMRAARWKLPLVWVADLLFGVGRAVATGWTMVRILDQCGRVIWQRPFGENRKAAHQTWLAVQQDLKSMDPTAFAGKYGLRME